MYNYVTTCAYRICSCTYLCVFAHVMNRFRTCFPSNFSWCCFDLVSQVAGGTRQNFMRLGLTVRLFCNFSLFVPFIIMFWCEFQLVKCWRHFISVKCQVQTMFLFPPICFTLFINFKCLHVFPSMFNIAELAKSELAR